MYIKGSLIVLSVGFVHGLQNLTFVNSQYQKAVFGNSLAPSSLAPKFMQPLCLKLENELEQYYQFLVMWQYSEFSGGSNSSFYVLTLYLTVLCNLLKCNVGSAYSEIFGAQLQCCYHTSEAEGGSNLPRFCWVVPSI